MADHPLLTDTLQVLGRLQLHLKVTAGGSPEPTGYWVEGADMRRPDHGPLVPLLDKFSTLGFATNKRAAAASLLLRFGWASGFAIGAYLTCRRVPIVDHYALQFSAHTLLHRLILRDVYFVGEAADPLAAEQGWTKTVPPADLCRALFDSLVGFAEPVVAAQRQWSGFSRHALWSMVTSSWAAQFSSIARQLGNPASGIAEAQALFSLSPELKKAAPEVYEIRVGDTSCTCQKRAACCLYFKSPGRPFCSSCPIIPEAERLERNRAFIAQQKPLVSA